MARADMPRCDSAAWTGALELALQDNLLTVADVARTLRISRRTVYRLIDTGKLPRIYIGRSPRFRPTDLDALVDAGVERAPEAADCAGDS